MPKTVLVVDDDALFQATISDGLRAAGYEVAVAGDGLEALERVRAAPPDFILLDLILPKLDGIRTCKLFKRHPEHRAIPIILLTGIAGEGLTGLDDLGAEGIVAKRQADDTLDEILTMLRALEVPGGPSGPPREAAQGLRSRRIVTELVAERQHVQTLLATLGEGVVQLDERGRVVYLNPAASRILDRTEDDLLGTPGADLLGSGHTRTLQTALRELQAGSGAEPLRLELTHGPKTLGLTLTALVGPGVPPEGLIVIRDLTDLSRRTRSFQALAAVEQHILGKLDLPVLLREIVTRAAELMQAEQVALFRVERAGQQLHLCCTASLGLSERYTRGLYLAPGEGVVARAVAEGTAVWSSDLLRDPAIRLSPALRALDQAEGIGAILAAPIRAPEGAFGALTVYRPAGHLFAAEEVELVTSLAGCAAIAIENARLYDALQRRADEATALAEVGRTLSGSLDLDRVLELVVQEVKRGMGVPFVGIMTLDAERRELTYAKAAGVRHEDLANLRLKVGEGIAGRAVELGAPVASPRLLEDPRYVHVGLAEEHGFRSLLAVPLVAGGRPLGALAVFRREEHDFAPSEIDLLSQFADQAALAIENARLYAGTRRAYEELQAAQDRLVQFEKLRALGELAGGVAHDFNNLLAVILGRAQLLRTRPLDTYLDKGLHIIEHAALDGAETVRRILGFARAGTDTHPSPVDVASLLAQVLDVTRPRWKDEAQGRGAAIEADLALEPVPPVEGHAAELREALVNLVFNAVDAMPQGGRLTLEARLVASPPSGGGAAPPQLALPTASPARHQALVEICVRDTGAGMSAEVRRRAFEPFFSTKGTRGSGLGLAMVYGIVTRQGGEVLLDSQEGVGTAVALRFPPAGQPAANPDETPGVPAGRTGRIMVVDDEASLGENMAELLRLSGHVVEAFTDPRRALEYLAREPVDLLFTDLGMPELSGWELARQARAIQPGLPQVLVTGWAQGVDPAQIWEYGIDAVVAKPYQMNDILRVVAELLPAPAQR